MTEDRTTTEVVQPEKSLTPSWLKFVSFPLLVLLSPLILYLLTLIVIGLLASGDPLAFFHF